MSKSKASCIQVDFIKIFFISEKKQRKLKVLNGSRNHLIGIINRHYRS